MKTTFLISLAAVLSTPLYAQCLPEEGRFEKATIDYHGTNYWVINDNRTNLQWMMCPMGQQGEQPLPIRAVAMGLILSSLSCHNRRKHWSSYIKPLLRTKRSSIFSTNDTKTTWLHWRKNVSPTRR